MGWHEMGRQKGPEKTVKIGPPHPYRWLAMKAQCGKGCSCMNEWDGRASACIVKIYQELYGVKRDTENEVS
jgi:hypothetical protein